jgi:deoxyribose-phosphate aldolase
MEASLLSAYAAKIDHTLLKPDTTLDQIKQLCQEAKQHKFAAVCFAPCWSNYVSNLIIGDEIRRATVVGFPHGNSYFLEKSNSANAYCSLGVNELDVVVNIGMVKSGEWYSIKGEVELFEKLKQYRKNSANQDVVVKYIVEVGYLTDDELFRIADILIEHKIDFIKTCTGYGPRNVGLEDIVKIKKHVGDAIKIKASGGVKDADFFLALIEMGADRVGTSSSVKIMEELGAMP